MRKAEVSLCLSPKVRSQSILLKFSHIRVFIIELTVQQDFDNFLKGRSLCTADSRHDTDLDRIIAPLLDFKVIELLHSFLVSKEATILLNDRLQFLADTKLRTDDRSTVSEELP